MHKETLEKAQSVATIFSLVAVPALIAWAAHSFQARESEAVLKKDYVTLAIGILTKSKAEEADAELRQWAADIVDRNAPVPLPASLKAKLSAGEARFATAYRHNAAQDYYRQIAIVEKRFKESEQRFNEIVTEKVAKGVDPKKAAAEATVEIYNEITQPRADLLQDLLDF